jgi:hypothetical protein
MTAEPTSDFPSISPQPQIPNVAEEKAISTLEELFTLGYTVSKHIRFYEDDQGNFFQVQFRSLTPCEYRDIAEVLGYYRSQHAQTWTEKIETLARAIVSINYMPLLLDPKDRKDYEEKNGSAPTSLEQARIILYNKIKSSAVIDMLYDEYTKFVEKVAAGFDDVKKKLNSQPSSELTPS